ncbi:MAG: AarF/ABC1/UbiB kinase family protein [Deltaproteobacteria bacterium]|nr:AarF/ABC1/UbiB kinase family protein [Deltaproteobacteria bacterium]
MPEVEAKAPSPRLGSETGPARASVAAFTTIPSGVARAPRVTSGLMARQRPLSKSWRWLKAYMVTFRVIMSYLSVRFQARFRSADSIARLLERKHLRNARRIQRAIAELQGLYLKVGQLFSIMSNFLPEQFRQQLESLQDQVPPRSFKEIERRFREEFEGKAPRELFDDFAELPVASASIGQVHRARLKSGETVAVKVQYPDVEEIVRIDLNTLRRIFGIVSWFVPYRGLDAIWHEIKAIVMEELDYTIEADNLEAIAANFEGHREDVAFPRVIRELSTARVLTTEWVEGIKVSDKVKLKQAGFDLSALARLVVEAYCKQIFTDGLYHADPHPGNILVRAMRGTGGAPQPAVVFLDFGAVARVSPAMRHGMVELIQGALARDTPRIVRALKEMGFVSRTGDQRVFEKVVDYFHNRFQEEIHLDSLNLRDIKFDPEKGLENLADLRKMDISLRDISESFHVPKEWIMLERTVLLLMGLCTELDPAMNPMAVIRPYLEEFVLGKDKDWTAFAIDTSKEVAMSVLALPGEMKKFMSAAQRGELEMRLKNLEPNVGLLYALGHQLIWTALGITAATFALVWDGRGEFQRATYAAYTAGGFGVLLLLSFLTGSRKKRKR